MCRQEIYTSKKKAPLVERLSPNRQSSRSGKLELCTERILPCLQPQTQACQPSRLHHAQQRPNHQHVQRNSSQPTLGYGPLVGIVAALRSTRAVPLVVTRFGGTSMSNTTD